MTLQQQVVAAIGREKLTAYRQGLLWYVGTAPILKDHERFQYGICYALNAHREDEFFCAYDIWNTLLDMGVPIVKVLQEWRYAQVDRGQSLNGVWYVRTECAYQLSVWLGDALE